MSAWGFHWFPWGQHLQRKKANFGCVLIQCCQKRTLFYPDTVYAELKCYPPPLAIKNRENMEHNVAVCPGTLLVTGCWELSQWTSQTPSSDLSLIVTMDLRLRVVCRGNNNWCWQKHFPGQFVGPRLLHSIACSRIRFLYNTEISLCHTKSWKDLQWVRPSLALLVWLIDFSCME